MASGSNAPFSGEFVDLENVPKLPEGISAEQIFENNSDVVRQVAEARHKAGLSQVNADGGFFDAFVNQTKLSNLNKTLLQNQKAKLGFGNTIKSTKSFTLSNNTSRTQNTTATFEMKETAILSRFKSTVGNSSNVNIDIKIKDQDGNILASDSLTTGGDFANFTFSFSGSDYSRVPQKGELIDLVLNADISVFDGRNGTASNDFAEFKSGEILDIDVPSVTNEIDFSTLELNQSGKITENQFTFTDTQGNSFSPSKVGIFPDQNLNGQSISYDLKDSSGSVVKTFNQADLNQLINVSTTDSSFQVEANFSGDGSKTPELEFLDVRGV